MNRKWIGIVALCLALAGWCPGAEPLRIMSWNLHHGAGVDGKVDLERIAAVIRREEPDVVLLQEVDKHCARSGNTDQAAELGRLLEMHHAFGKALDLGDGEYGQAILSRHPLGDPEVHRLPGGGEPRIVFSCRVDAPGGSLTAATLHLDHQDDGRPFAQAQVASAELLKTNGPVVLGGDFNAGPESRTLRVFAQAPWNPVPKAGPAATHPAENPATEIDHIILRGLAPAKAVVVIDESAASDHRPLLVEIQR